MAKFNVIFAESMCKGCNLCVTVCPKKIISLNLKQTNGGGYNPAQIADMDACIGCRSCAITCPDSVISIVKND